MAHIWQDVPHAEFSIEAETPGYIYIIDTGHNHTRTVTNDPEFVCEILSMDHSLRNRRLFYQDSMGEVDELLHAGPQFTGFKAGHSGIEL